MPPSAAQEHPQQKKKPAESWRSSGFSRVWGTRSAFPRFQARAVDQARACVLALALAFFAGAAAGASTPFAFTPFAFGLEPSRSAASFFERAVFSQVNSLRPK